jgi:radical SAM protein with 4Fe4S-binding SPASM domain
MLLQWHVTERCNLRCSHCYQEEYTPHAGWDALLATLEQLESFLATCRARRAGLPFRGHLTITGGEPFAHRDFMRLLERVAASRTRCTWAVLTNGTLVDRSRARALAALGAGFVQVSLDGTPATHDRIRGAGSHARAVAGIRELVAARVPVLVSFTAQRSTFREFPAVARLGRALGVDKVWSDRLIPHGQGAGHDEVMGPADTREWVELMRAERRREKPGRSPVTMHRALQFSDAGDCRYRCTAGDTLVTVLPGGDVLPCRRMPIVAGNLHRQPLAAIYDAHPAFRALRDRTRPSRGCEKCFYSETCGGGLRCLSYAIYGDPFRADPGCWLAGDRGPAPAAHAHGAPPVLVPVSALTRRQDERTGDPAR